jgi:dolichyl-phosphate beta-glucosyltransferase
VGLGSVGVALVPLVPTPYPVVARPQVPQFISSGDWRSFVRPGHTLVVAPLPWAYRASPMLWAERAGMGFALAGGYFRGPDSTGNYALFTSIPRPTSQLFEAVQSSGRPVAPDPTNQAAIQADLAYWQADALMIDPSAAQEPLRQTIQDLLGRPAATIDGVSVWRMVDVR